MWVLVSRKLSASKIPEGQAFVHKTHPTQSMIDSRFAFSISFASIASLIKTGYSPLGHTSAHLAHWMHAVFLFFAKTNDFLDNSITGSR